MEVEPFSPSFPEREIKELRETLLAFGVSQPDVKPAIELHRRLRARASEPQGDAQAPPSKSRLLLAVPAAAPLLGPSGKGTHRRTRSNVISGASAVQF